MDLKDKIEKFKKDSDELGGDVKEGGQYLSNIFGIAAALLVVATFNNNLIPLNFLSRFLISGLLLIIPLNFWLGYFERHRLISFKSKNLQEQVKNAFPDNPEVVKAIERLNRRSVSRIIQFSSAIFFTIAIILFVFMIWDY